MRIAQNTIVTSTLAGGQRVGASAASKTTKTP